MQRKTETASYWIEDFSITEADIDEIYNVLLDATTPVPTSELAKVVIRSRVGAEERQLRKAMAKGKLYQPREEYKIGATLIFPALGFQTGEVIGQRKGQNPMHGAFKVIEVKMEDGRIKEFAAALSSEHKLNLPAGTDLWQVWTAQQESSDLVEEYGDIVAAAIEANLRENEDAVRFPEGWVLSSSLADVNIGHLNITEALIEVKGEPVTAEEIIAELDLPEDILPEIKVLSLERRLFADERFRRVETGNGVRWFLARLLPEAVAKMPSELAYTPISYDHDQLDVNQRQLEWEVGDEWSEIGAPTAPPETVDMPSSRITARQVLIFPHYHARTLPYNQRIAAILPQFKANIGMITFIDGRWGNRFNAWVVKDGRYIAGLDKWYEEHKILVGTLALIEGTDTPGEYRLDVKPKRMKREWVRTASVEQDNLVFEMKKQEINSEVDDYIVLGLHQEEAIVDLARKIDWESVTVESIVHHLVQELAKLSPQGTVHAKSVYSAFNLLRRCPPGPILAALSDGSRYRNAGDNYYALVI